MKRLLLTLLFLPALALPAYAADAEPAPEEDMPDAALILDGDGNPIQTEKDAADEKTGD